jgi:hypothetical protein
MMVFLARTERDLGKTLRPSTTSVPPAETMHILFEIASAILVIIPLIAVGQAYRQTRSPRLLFAFAAFLILELRFSVLVAVHSFVVVDHSFEETIDFLTDLIAIALFAAAFLYATGWPHGRVRADLA